MSNRFKFSICFWAPALEFLMIWLWNVLNGNKLMLSTESTFGGPFSKFPLNSEEKTNCAVPATKWVQQPLQKQLCNSLTFANDHLSLHHSPSVHEVIHYTYFWWQIRTFEADTFLVLGSPANAAVSVVRTWFEVGFTHKSPATFRRCKRWHYGPFSPPPQGEGALDERLLHPQVNFPLQCTVKLWPWLELDITH